MFLKPPDGTEWKVYWTKNDGELLLEKGWKEFAAYYSLDHGHLLLFKYKETSHFEVHICDMSGLEIDYPFHGTQDEGDEAVEILDEMPPSQNTRLKSPMSSPQPCKRLRAGTTGDVTKSYNLQNLPQLDQINGNNQSQGANFENSTFLSVKKELDGMYFLFVNSTEFWGQIGITYPCCSIFSEDIGGITQCPKVEQSTKATKAVNKATTIRSKRNPSFMLVMKPSYASSYSLVSF